MIKYFRELENPNDQYLDLIDKYHFLNYHDIKLDYIPLDYFLKHKDLFYRIKEYDFLNDLKDKEKKIYFDNTDTLDDEISVDWAYLYYTDILFPPSGITELSKNGIYKMYELEILAKREGIEFDYDYYEMIDFHITYTKGIFTTNKKFVLRYINNCYRLAERQKKLTAHDDELFSKAIKELKEYKFEVPKNDFEPIKMYLPNAWYITPYNHLYNTMGKNGHKEANLIYPYYHHIIRDNHVANPVVYLKKIQKILKDECIDKMTFDSCTNLIYDFTSIYPEEYYNLSDKDKSRYRNMYEKTYNPKIVKLIVGIESAHAGLYNFFYNLKNNSLDYKSDLEYLKQFDLDDILVRCCGFHKISSTCDKTITTSCINYEEEFKEYINKGWKIDFIKPIIFNEYIKRVEAYPDDFLIIRKVLKSNNK